mgnify:CR=1 FL=1
MKRSTTKKISRIHEEKMSTQKEKDYRQLLDEYFAKSIGSNVEKMENFAKYVPRQMLTRFLSKYELFKKVLNIHGSIVECGVYLGGGAMTFAHLSSILEPVNWQRQVVGFDTFSGFKNLSEADKKTSKSEFMKEDGLSVDSYQDLQCSISLFDQNRFLGHLPKVQLIKGDVRETIPDYLEKNPHTVISLLYLDFDVYEPTKIALESFLPRMPKGAIVAFDELNAPNWPGETIAVMETLGIKYLRLERFQFDTLISYAVLE